MDTSKKVEEALDNLQLCTLYSNKNLFVVCPQSIEDIETINTFVDVFRETYRDPSRFINMDYYILEGDDIDEVFVLELDWKTGDYELYSLAGLVEGYTNDKFTIIEKKHGNRSHD